MKLKISQFCIFLVFLITMIAPVSAADKSSKNYQCIVINKAFMKYHYFGSKAPPQNDILLVFGFDNKDFVKWKGKFQCEFDHLDAKTLRSYIGSNAEAMQTGVYLKTPIKVNEKRLALKTRLFEISYEPIAFNHNEIFEKRLNHCDFQNQAEVNGLNLVKFNPKKDYCLWKDNGHLSYIGRDKIDDSRVDLNCKDSLEYCNMSFDYRQFKLEILDFPKNQISHWQQIKTQIIAHFEDHLVMHFVSPKQCEGEYCKTFLKN